MFGFSLLVAWLLFSLAGRKSWWPVAVAGVVCLLLAVGTYQRNRVWQDAVTLWSDAVSKSPQHARAHNNWGLALAGLGRHQEAVGHYQQALRIKPDYPEAHNNWGSALAIQRRLPEAAEQYRRALRLKPDFSAARDNLRRIEELLQQKTGPARR
jgi:tetratricopeptide (TPR) repeat protein